MQSESRGPDECPDRAPTTVGRRRIWLLWDMWRLGLLALWFGVAVWALVLGIVEFKLKAIEKSREITLGSQLPVIVSVAIAPAGYPTPWLALSVDTVRKISDAILRRRHRCFFEPPEVEFLMKLRLADGSTVFMPASISEHKLYLLGYPPGNIGGDYRIATVGRWVWLSPLSPAQRKLIHHITHLDG
ncbi:MAG: hypothetical protein HKL96_03845 [Phycisphaerales bacterium]|nr:hypothetical protein [Phycisphaerales bacterium]